VVGRVDDAPRLTPGPFDLVFVTWGTICWLPDLTVWAHVIATVLALGGELYFADAHPSLLLMEDRGGKLEPTYDFQTPMDRPLEFQSETRRCPPASGGCVLGTYNVSAAAMQRRLPLWVKKNRRRTPRPAATGAPR
jgi:hypothetical protein